MTCLAVIRDAKGKLFMAADRRSSYGMSKAYSMEVPKINKINKLLVAACGHGALCTELVNNIRYPKPVAKVRLTDIDKNKSYEAYMLNDFRNSLVNHLKKHPYYVASKDDEPIHSIMLVGVGNEIWEVDVDNGKVSMDRVATPHTSGCGGQLAMGAILAMLRSKHSYSPQDILRTSLEIAAEVSPGCNEVIDILEN